MSRSRHPQRRDRISIRHDKPAAHPYWVYGWCYHHGPKDVRTYLHHQHRAQVRQALHHGEDPPERPQSAHWIWW